ncbi:MAG: dephospho-CoA kinase [Chloroflexi bacterium]|nr:dephospho-CoA kinase [Chloroflexota bacterium]
MHVIGLTGGVGSGKSTVSQFLQELGVTLLDADVLGHESYLPNTACWKELVDTFGPEILLPSQEIDRKKLGSIVFSDPALLEQLNAIVWPHIRDLALGRLEGWRSEGKEAVVLEAAILIEANWTSLTDEVWVTEAPEDVVVKRVLARNPTWGEDQIRSRINSQLSNEERAKHAHVVIDTNKDLSELKAHVQALYQDRVAAKISAS